MKSLKLSDYFSVIKPEYVYLKLTPTNSIRNYNSDKIAKAISSLYRNLMQSIRKYNNKYFFDAPCKVSYFIYLEKSKAEFYFVIPKNHLTLLKERIGDTWKNITISQVNEIPTFSDEAIKYKLTYKKEDALSLSVDHRTNTLLSSILNVIDVIEEGDKMFVIYNFIPTSQFPWRAQFENTMKKLDEFRPIDKEKLSINFAIKMIIMLMLELANICNDVIGSVLGSNKKEKINYFDFNFLLKEEKRKLLPETMKKKDSVIIKTQLLVVSESKDNLRANNSAQSVCQAFQSISGDNSLVYKKHRNVVDINKFSLKGVDQICMSPSEAQNLLALPAKELLEEYKVIDRIDTYESEVDLELRKGIMYIGENTYKGKTQRAFLSNDPQYKFLSLCIVAPTRGGKSTLIANLAKNCVENNETSVILDFCGNNELSNEVTQAFKGKNVLNIDLSDFENIQGLGYNEISESDNSDTFKQYRNAKIQTSQFLTLINSINEQNKELSVKMDRYLIAASLITFISNGSIKDVFSVLQNYKMRKEYIDKIPENQKENLEEYALSLKEIDEVDKKSGEAVGSRVQAMAGIIDRINKLKQNPYMELMLKKDCSKNFNMVKEINKPQLITLRMSEVMFSTSSEKDIYATYWLTKLWLSLQLRAWNTEASKRTKVNIFIDEIYQIPNGEEFLRSKLSQIAKTFCKIIISCHHLSQIPIIRNELKASNCSYMIISGSNKDVFNELKEELIPYTLEDLLNLKRYHSLNLIKCNDSMAKFITRLPPPCK